MLTIGENITAEDHADHKTTIVIKPHVAKWKLILMASWLVGFTFVGIYMFWILFGGVYTLEVISDNIEDTRDKQLIYTIVFLGFWFYFEYKTLKATLWFLYGRELIKLDRESLTYKKSILGYGKASSFFYDNMKNIHLFTSDNTSFGQFFENAIWSQGTDGIIFNYFGKEKSFGKRLDEKSSKLLLRFIDDRIKKLRKVKSKVD